MRFTPCIDNGVAPRGCGGGGGGGPGTASNPGASAGIEIVDVQDNLGDPIDAVPAANNGAPYFPLASGSTIEFEIISYDGQEITIGLAYAMNAANANTVAVSLEVADQSIGLAPTGTYAAPINDTLSPGSNVTLHFDQPTGFTFTPSATGDMARMRLTRGSDSHPATLNLFKLLPTIE